MTKGIQLALLAALLFGLSAPVAKLLVTQLPVQSLAAALYIGSGFGLMLVSGIHRGIQKTEPAIQPAQLPYLAGAIVSGGIIAPVLLLYGLRVTPGSNAALFLNLEAVFTVLIAWFVFRENLGPRIALGMAVIVAGSVLLSWSDGAGPAYGLRGPLALAGACLFWGIDNNLTQKISTASAIQLATGKGLAGGGMNLLLAYLLGERPAISSFVLLALVVGFLGYGVSLVLYIRAMRDLGAARAGNYFSISPFVGAVAGLLLFQENITIRLIGSGVLMAVGIWLHVTEKHSHWHIHEPITHEHVHIHDLHHQHEHGPNDPKGEPHSHPHVHTRLEHSHPHFPDIHHHHDH
jgi:drug/metabolite transporter (DMT)-like permease